jgi:hypothetical protein|tara:strand:- start:1638 stop:1979 length:342 start_codon:yes stop_codon:yes gene_type:complete
MNRIEMIKKAAMTVEAKKLGLTFEQYKGKLLCDTLDARKAAIKVAEKLRKKEERRIKKDLTGQVKKAGHLASGNLDFNRPENMYYSDKDTEKFLADSSIMDAYNANRSADGDY